MSSKRIASKPSKKAVAAFRANTDAIDRVLYDPSALSQFVLARVESCLGNSQFRLKMIDGAEGRGTPLGKFTYATLRIAPGQVVICEPGKGVLTIVGRFDRHKDVGRLVKEKRVPRSFLTGDVDGACFEDGFEFDDEPADDDDDSDKDDNESKIRRYLKQHTTSKQRAINPLQQAQELAVIEQEAIAAVHCDEVDYESRRFKRTKAKKSTPVPIAKPAAKSSVQEDDDVMVEAFVKSAKVPDNWEDEIDIDAI